LIKQLWSTPILQRKMNDFLREELINRLMQDYDIFNPPSDYSKINVLDNQATEIQQFLYGEVLPSFEEFCDLSLNKTLSDWTGYRVNGWLTGSSKDYSMQLHNHSGSQFSAVFYLLCEEQEMGGEIVFTDPRQNANRGYDSKFSNWFEPLKITPKSGDILVFPSYLYHTVLTYHSNLRLAMPVDCFLFADS